LFGPGVLARRFQRIPSSQTLSLWRSRAITIQAQRTVWPLLADLCSVFRYRLRIHSRDYADTLRR
jgi:hypothetical protein